MESKLAHEEFVSAESPLTQPHFDDETTLLSARPVVPLDEVRAEARSGRRLVVGLAIMAALMVGVLGAILVYKQPGKKQATAILATNNPTSEQPTQQASAAIDTSEESKAQTATMAKPAPPISPGAELGSGSETDQNLTKNQNNERERLRAERMETRHPRRLAEGKEARRHKNQPSDDLLRIREIFEGSPRP
jgi:hypothetical protein